MYTYDVYINKPGYTKRFLGTVEAFDDESALKAAKDKYRKEDPETLSVEIPYT